MLVLFVVLDDGVRLDDLVEPIKLALRSNLSPRHVPDEIHALPSIPTTLSGKKLELPVKKILRGADPDSVASRGALKNPESLDAVVEDLATLRATDPCGVFRAHLGAPNNSTGWARPPGCRHRRRRVSGEVFDDDGDALADADAHRRQAVPAAGATQEVGQRW